MKETAFTVLSKPCNYPFIVDASKTEDFNKKKMPKEVFEEIKKTANDFDKNNLQMAKQKMKKIGTMKDE